MARRVARFNRVVSNRIHGLWAWLVPPWAIVIHQGRRSGRTYRTPVVAYKRGTDLAVALLYGDDTDWVRNLLVAGGGRLRRAGREWVLQDPQIVERGDREKQPRGARWFVLPTRKVLVATLHAP